MLLLKSKSLILLILSFIFRWRIVIHGAIDGFSRLVTFLEASNNNRSSTVLEKFVSAVDQYGVPSRVRCDQGGENNAVCIFMEVFQGSARGSALRGRSTHNQRIERLWGDVWRGVVNVYYSLFSILENDRILDCNNESHLWALHYIYLPQINRDLGLFINQWNHHRLRTARHVTISNLCAWLSLPTGSKFDRDSGSVWC